MITNGRVSKDVFETMTEGQHLAVEVRLGLWLGRGKMNFTLSVEPDTLAEKFPERTKALADTLERAIQDYLDNCMRDDLGVGQ
jgi:hypothetical protein